jgi:hypothetical protein
VLVVATKDEAAHAQEFEVYKNQNFKVQETSSDVYTGHIRKTSTA